MTYMRDWKKAEITLATNEGTRLTEALVRGVFGIHCYYDFSGTDLRVTHIPTGLAFPQPANEFRSLRAAARFVDALLEQEDESFWATGTFRLGKCPPKRWMKRGAKAFTEACRQVGL